MTEGIIQEVFKLVIDRYKSKLPNPYFSEVIERTINDFELLQQELIEKIKQEVDKMQMSIIYRDGLKRVLIGDNKE